MKYIYIGKGRSSIVDDEDYFELNKFSWHIAIRKHTAYAHRRVGPRGASKTIFMHREILCVEPGMFVDHVNGDGLDNRKVNLRACTRSQNAANSRKPQARSSSASRFKGVYWHHIGKKWAAGAGRGRGKFLGLFDDEVSAARAYDMQAKKLFGDFARLNFGEDR